MPDIKLITGNLGNDLIPALQKATGIYILTSFVMKSGVRILAPYLKEAAERGADVKCLASDYLYITQPDALRELVRMDARIEVRLWESRGASFHPKAYLMDDEQGEGLLIVGSSNMSRSALRTGVEWNLAMNEVAEPSTFQEALEKFMGLFYDERTVPVNEVTITRYEEQYVRNRQQFPAWERTISEDEEAGLMLPELGNGRPEVEEGSLRSGTEMGADSSSNSGDDASAEPQQQKQRALVPREAQQQALEALERTRAEQYEKAMVVMATGLGKTYLAAFWARGYRRVLFVAHREEILHQARKSFEVVSPERTSGFYYATHKEPDAEVLFASIYTLGMQKHRECFAPDAFDLIVVDEFHHAASRSYRALLDYFKPKFLLGITATPDRMDGQDVYALCEGNVAYQLHFIEAIERQWLCPFQYYGVYDETDYSQIAWLGRRYDEEQLMLAQLRDEMAAKIYAAWDKHRQTRTIAFCSSIRQANFLAKYFREQGVACVSLHSQTVEMSRQEAVQRLTGGELDVIFTVDLFNEGVDIPAVDTLLFVRPTESLSVFVQQVGRGLRLHPGKSHCVIIDLIGNYRHADTKLMTLLVDGGQGERGRAAIVAETAVPSGCMLKLDARVISLLDELARKKQPRKQKLRESYEELKQELGRRPDYLELHLLGRAASREYKQEFRSYVGFLAWSGELDEREKALYHTYKGWLEEVESTVMTKSYKMAVLLYLLERGAERWTEAVSSREMAAWFHQFYMEKAYRKQIDFSDQTARKLWVYDEAKVAGLIERMPMTMWSGSSKGYVKLSEVRSQMEGDRRNRETDFSDSGADRVADAGAVVPYAVSEPYFMFHVELELPVSEEEREQLYRWTKDICLYRLHVHFERRAALTGQVDEPRRDDT